MNTGPEITPADHDAGCKEIEVLWRNGTAGRISLAAPSYRQAQRLTLQMQKEKDALCITAACLERECLHLEMEPEKLLNRLTPESAALVENTAFALTFGADFQKKMSALGQKLAAENQTATDSTSTARRFELSVPVTPQGTCADFLCPNCACTIALSVKPTSSATSAPSTSPPVPA
jgi:hypothetical protein